MVDASSDGQVKRRHRIFWHNLKICVRLEGDFGGHTFAFGSVIKAAEPLKQKTQQRKRSGRLRRGSAVGKSLEVQELRHRLQRNRDLLVKWEDAGEPVTDELLWRWLRSKRSVDEAEACLLEHAQWRIGLAQITEADIKSELDAKKTFLQGCDSHGRPIIVILAARHIIKQRNLGETKKLITYTLENAIACSEPVLNPTGQILCLFDLSGLGFGNLDTKALQAVFEVLQQHFPESLSELWFLNAPFIFWGLWKVVSPFIQPATKEKIKFLNGRSRAQMLEDNIPVQVLPQLYGGKAELIPIDTAVKRFASQLTLRMSGATTALAEAENQGRLASVRRIGGQRALRGWHFIKDHNPLWAARVFGQGIKRVPSVLLRPNWHRSRPVISRHASAVSIHVRNAWNNRPAMPRPHYRLKQQAIEQRAARQYVDVASFYILAVVMIAIIVISLKKSTLLAVSPSMLGQPSERL